MEERLPIARDALTSCSCELLVRPATVPVHGAPPFPPRCAARLCCLACCPRPPPRRQELSPLLQGDARAARWLRERTEPVSHLVVQDGGDKGRRRRIRAMQEQSAKQAEMSTLSHRDFDIKGDFKG